MEKRLFHLTRLAKGKVLVLGDFNARHQTRDTFTTKQGRLLAIWAYRTDFVVAATASPTCYSTRQATRSIGSKVDLILGRGLSMHTPTLLPGTWHTLSDHLPLTTVVYLETPSRFKRVVPSSLLKNPAVREKVRAGYVGTLPLRARELLASTSPQDLEWATECLARAFLQPWLGFLAHAAHNPARFRNGWTHASDRLAKRRSTLLKAPITPESKAEICHLAKEIRLQVRRRRQELRTQHLAAVNDGPMSQTYDIFKKVQQLRKEPRTVKTLDPETFTAFLRNTQPELDTSPPPTPFVTPPNFETQVLSAIRTMTPNKSPGPDWITAEMIQLTPELSASAISELWTAVGTLGYVPKLLRAGTVVPLIKREMHPTRATTSR